ncbi:mitochondrial inner membrane protein Mitofilin [Infundibulicybe gibba]|nr:mitochondrial inner membrane protein Mitofilin [Infundibulicybe gibba]
MYRSIHASRQVASGRVFVRATRRKLTTEAAPVPKKKKSIVRRMFWATTTLTGTFYVGSTFASFNNQMYYDFFSDHVPLGQSMLEYAETHGWDTITLESAMQAGVAAASTTKRFNTKHAVEKKAQEAKEVAVKAFNDSKSRVGAVASHVTRKAEAIARFQAVQVSEELQELVQKAEAALAGKPYPTKAPPRPHQKRRMFITLRYQSASKHHQDFSPASTKKNVHRARLRSSAPADTPLPLIAPAVSSLSASEPIISHLAGTIDNLASYLASNPTAATKASDVLESAKGDLTALVARIEHVKEEERTQLEAKLDEQTREYTLKLMELEMEAQDKLDSQEEGFRKFFDEERVKFVQAYREKLNHELQTQTELINERLKEEVIAQGIELQRRWIREIKVRVEQERGGRLAKIDELSAHLKRLERITLDNSDYLDENIRVHALWSAVRALASSALTAPVRRPFREELRVLRHIGAAREDPVVAAALESLEASDVPDVGVEPLADLATWFASEVAPKVCHVALVPDQDAGVLSYLASRALAGLRFRRRGLVPGDDVVSVLARAEHHLNEKDLDSAARELNQLGGAAKVLLQDWLTAARRRLEVQQALEIVQTQATLASLLVV